MSLFRRFCAALGGIALLLAVLVAVAPEASAQTPTAAAQSADPYLWDRPNTNRYTGTLEYALAHSNWPAHVVAAILADRSHCKWDVIPPDFQFEWMMFGDARRGKAFVKRNVIARTERWPKNASRRTLVCRYEDRQTMREYVFFIPEVCNNASGYSRPILACVCPPEVRVCAKK